MFALKLNYTGALKRWIPLFAVCLGSYLGSAGTSVVLGWDPSPDSAVIGYRLYIGNEPDVYSRIIDLGPATQAVASDLAWETLYYFAVTAYDAGMRESEFSGSIAYQTPAAPVQTIAPPVIHEQPAGQLVAKGKQIILSARWTGDAPLISQWYRGDLPLSNGPHFAGVNSPALSIMDADDSCAGIYSVVLSNPSGATRSLPAYVHVLCEPRIENVVSVGNGSSRISIANEDGSPLKSDQVFRLKVIASTNPAPTTAWTPLTNALVLTNGQVKVEDTHHLNYSQRYYRTLLTGSSTGPLRVESPERLADGSIRIGISRADGLRSITPAESKLIAVQASANPTTIAGWEGLRQPMQWGTSRLTMDDPEAASFTRRFYRAVIRMDDSPKLRLNPPTLTPQGSLELAISRADGMPMGNSDVFNYEVFVRTNFSASSQWTLLTHPMSYANGVLTIEDPGAASTPLRAYRVFAK
jgi:hypothetical protein